MDEELLPIIRKYSIKQDRVIKRLTEPISEQLSIPYFSRYTIDKNGNFTYLSNAFELCEFFYSEKLYKSCPYLVEPELLRSGLSYDSCTPETASLETIKSRFNMQDLFVILERTPDGIEGLLFGTKFGDPRGINLFLNNLDLLKKFGFYFARETETMLKKMKADGYNLKQAKGEGFFLVDESIPLVNHKAKEKKFLKEISPLSYREHQCLDLFRQGKSAKATAALLGLSRRTVEHYFENIKDKLGTFYKQDLLH